MRFSNETGIELLQQGFDTADIVFPGQLRVYLSMLWFFDEHKMWPTVREISEMTGTQMNGVHVQLRSLRRKGLIESHPTRGGIIATRSIRATRRATMFVN